MSGILTEVRVTRNGRTLAVVMRPLRQLDGLPAVTFRGKLWRLNNGSIDISVTASEERGLDESDSCPNDNDSASRSLNDTHSLKGSNGPVIGQHDAIGEPFNARLLIDAGPGTGKTHAACARVAAMVNDGIPATRVCLVSFTRTAVVEIRNRIARALSDPADAASVRIVTLDAFAWSVQSGFSQSARLTGSYENNIREAHRLINEDPEVRDDLMKIEHLIIDEAQDIVGPRAQLVLAMIDSLEPESGVSIYADKAQAIYEFSEDGDRAEGASLLDAVAHRGFKQVKLTKVHRTNDPKLLSIFVHLREKVLSRKAPTLETYVRDQIQRLAHGSVGDLSELDLSAIPADALVLMRNRMDVLDASSRAGSTPHRLRMSGLSPSLNVWLGQMFWDFTDRRMSRDEFKRRWAERNVLPTLHSDEAWLRCVEIAGSSHSLIELDLLRTALARKTPPMMFCTPEFSNEGPILGTIHASKGREAPSVYLYLKSQISHDKTGEEARVLFVGATRARNQLFVGTCGSHYSSHTNQRPWRKCSNGIQIEVGRADDLDATSLVGRTTFSRQEEALAAQLAWWNKPIRLGMTAKATAATNWQFTLYDGEQRLCSLSPTFRIDMNQIGSINRRTINWLGYVRSLGIRTLAVAPNDPQLETMLEPWKSSGFLFAPLISSLSFAPTRFRDANA